MPWRPTAKSSYLTKNHFQWNFISSPHSNQFTALSGFHFVVNTDRLSSVRTKRSVLRLHQKGNFITSNRGRALWAEFGWAAHASLMLSLSDKNTCMTQVSFLRRWEICRWATCLLQHTYLYVDLDRRSQTSTLLFLHLSSFTKKKQKKKTSQSYQGIPQSWVRRMGKWQQWLSPVEFTVQIRPRLKWPQCPATVPPTVCSATAV